MIFFHFFSYVFTDIGVVQICFPFFVISIPHCVLSLPAVTDTFLEAFVILVVAFS